MVTNRLQKSNKLISQPPIAHLRLQIPTPASTGICLATTFQTRTIQERPRERARKPEHERASERSERSERQASKGRGKRSEAGPTVDLVYWLTLPVCLVYVVFVLVLILFIVVVVVLVVAFFVFVCGTNLAAWLRSPGVRLFRLGGVTTLRRRLDYPCGICRGSMDAGDRVRTLSCGHVFHCGGTAECRFGIDHWLLAGNWWSLQPCPYCRLVPQHVPWRWPPPSSPAPSSPPAPPAPPAPQTEEEEEELLLPSHWFDDTLPEEAEEELLLPSHWFDDTLPEGAEGSSSE